MLVLMAVLAGLLVLLLLPLVLLTGVVGPGADPPPGREGVRGRQAWVLDHEVFSWLRHLAGGRVRR